MSILRKNLAKHYPLVEATITGMEHEGMSQSMLNYIVESAVKIINSSKPFNDVIEDVERCVKHLKASRKGFNNFSQLEGYSYDSTPCDVILKNSLQKKNEKNSSLILAFWDTECLYQTMLEAYQAKYKMTWVA